MVNHEQLKRFEIVLAIVAFFSEIAIRYLARYTSSVTFALTIAASAIAVIGGQCAVVVWLFRADLTLWKYRIHTILSSAGLYCSGIELADLLLREKKLVEKFLYSEDVPLLVASLILMYLVGEHYYEKNYRKETVAAGDGGQKRGSGQKLGAGGINFFTLSLPLLCLLLSRSCATTSTDPVLPQPSSAFLAADTLRLRGYSNYSGTLLAPPDFAFSFASTRILNNHRPPPRPSVPVLLYHTLRPPLVLTWPTLSSRDDGDELRTFYNNNCLYLFKSSRANEVAISSSPFTNPIATVKIRQPDLYVDEHLIVHGIDSVLNPSFATRCSVTYSDPTADTVPLQVNRVFLDRAIRALRRSGYNVVAAAMGIIRGSDLLSLTSVTVLAVSDEHLFMTPGGFNYDFRHHVVPIRQRFTDLARMTAGGVEFYTLAANKTVFIQSNGGAVTADSVSVGMREVYHNRWMVVVSLSSSLDEIADSQLNPIATAADSVPSPSPSPDVTENGDSSRIPSPSPNPSISATRMSYRVPAPAPIPRVSANGKSHRVPAPAPIPRVSVNGRSHRAPSPAPIARVSTNGRSHRIPSPAPSPGVSSKGRLHRVPSPAPAYTVESENGNPVLAPVPGDDYTADSDWIEAPSPAVESDEDDSLSSSPSPGPEIDAAGNPVRSPVPSPATDDIDIVHCDLNVVISNGVEGGDLLCPDRIDRAVSRLRETGSLRDDVEAYQPFDVQSQDVEDWTHSRRVKVADHVNIADDVFFYT